jgi:methylglutaconyl-CoA hydratase
MDEVVQVERQSGGAFPGGIARVWLNRPEVRNAFNQASIAELTRVFAELSRDDGLRVVVLGGRGKAFCAGADLHWMRAMAGYTWEQNRTDAQALADMLWTVYCCPVPVIGRIQGDCYAGGVGLASVCDVLVAAETATFCLSEARIGLLPATISPYVIRALGEQASRRYFATAERFSAAQAHGLGFVHELCTLETIDVRVDSLAAVVVANAPMATRACKRLVADVAGEPISADLRAETARRIADIRASAEGREGVQSFLQKRRPAWLGAEPPVSAGGAAPGSAGSGAAAPTRPAAAPPADAAAGASFGLPPNSEGQGKTGHERRHHQLDGDGRCARLGQRPAPLCSRLPHRFGRLARLGRLACRAAPAAEPMDACRQRVDALHRVLRRQDPRASTACGTWSIPWSAFPPVPRWRLRYSASTRERGRRLRRCWAAAWRRPATSPRLRLAPR